MAYRYKRSQIPGLFRKLPVPENIREQIFNGSLLYEDYNKYELWKYKVPRDCLECYPPGIIRKFGKERLKDFDYVFYDRRRELMDKVDANSTDINKDMYIAFIKSVADKCRREGGFGWSGIDSDFTDSFYKTFPRSAAPDIYYIDWLRYCCGELSDEEILKYWKKGNRLLKSETLDKLEANDPVLFGIFLKNGNLKNIAALSDTESIRELLLHYFKNINGTANEEYETALKYIDIKDCFPWMESWGRADDFEKMIQLAEQINNKITVLPFKFCELTTQSFYLIERLGLGNICEFERDNGGGIFADTGNLWELYDMYFHYDHSGDFEARDKTSPNWWERATAKEEFYETVRRFCSRGPSNWEHRNVLDYRNIKGKFREMNPDLFLEDNSPEELKDAFYTHELDYKMLKEHPEWCENLRDKVLSFVHSSFSPNYYELLMEKTGGDYDKTMKMIFAYFGGFRDEVDIEVPDTYDTRRRMKTRVNITHAEIDIDAPLDVIERQMGERLKDAIYKTGLLYDENMPENFKRNFPMLFLPENLDKRLPNAAEDMLTDIRRKFYSRQMTAADFINNKDLLVAFGNTDILLGLPWEEYSWLNDYKGMINNQQRLAFLLRYEAVTDEDTKGAFKTYDAKKVFNLLMRKTGGDFDKVLDMVMSYFGGLAVGNHNQEFYEDIGKISEKADCAFIEFILGKRLRAAVDDRGVIYGEEMPEEFKKTYPELFVPESVSEGIRRKFYSRTLSVKDFEDNKDLLRVFGNANVMLGFPFEETGCIQTFEGINNEERFTVFQNYAKIADENLKYSFRNGLVNLVREGADIHKLVARTDILSELLLKLNNSNSGEIQNFKTQIAQQLLMSADPIKTFDMIESVFVKNNLPTVGKLFNVFLLLHPDCMEQAISRSNTISPMLKACTALRHRKKIIGSDLLKCALGSNNRSFITYLENIEKGNELYLKNGEPTEAKDKKCLNVYKLHLKTLFDYANKTGEEISKENLPDQLVRMFVGFAGCNTLEQAKNYIRHKTQKADADNRKHAEEGIAICEGDLVKGLNSFEYIKNILQNGSVAREFLGADATSDSTPLDIDLAKVQSVKETLIETIRGTPASNYGGSDSLYLLFKNDGRFYTTRKDDGTISVDTKREREYELFQTGVAGNTHYGIRTGVASSEIYAIVSKDENIKKLGVEIAKNGFYIPVCDNGGKLAYTAKDYDKLREKMAGLSYYGAKEYKISSELQDYSSAFGGLGELKEKCHTINDFVADTIKSMGYPVKNEIDGDISGETVEVINTGSTGRGTALPGNSDFDFIVRVDRKMLGDGAKMQELKDKMISGFGGGTVDGDGNFRLKDVSIEGVTDPIDIDITFNAKTNDINYATEMALTDRLDSIKEQYPKQYEAVVSNILMAKEMLKQAGVYKPRHSSENAQGGLGGIGTENWILQNGGSLITAAKSFLNASDGKSLEEFQEEYPIWDFGENYLASKSGHYPHDNFILNMDESGYQKMRETLTAFMENSKTFEVRGGKENFNNRNEKR